MLEMKSQGKRADGRHGCRSRGGGSSPRSTASIVQVYVRKGEWVEPGQKALRIVNVDRLKAEGFIPAAAATAELLGTAGAS